MHQCNTHWATTKWNKKKYETANIQRVLVLEQRTVAGGTDSYSNCLFWMIDASSLRRQRRKEKQIIIGKMRWNRPVSRSVFTFSIVLYLVQSALPITDAYSVNGSLLIGPAYINGKYVKYTIEDLMNGQFEYKVSDDIDMDPCKSSMYLWRAGGEMFAKLAHMSACSLLNRIHLHQGKQCNKALNNTKHRNRIYVVQCNVPFLSRTFS